MPAERIGNATIPHTGGGRKYLAGFDTACEVQKHRRTQLHGPAEGPTVEGYVRLHVAEYRLRIRFTQSGRLSAHLGTTIRGGFGRALRQMSCVQTQTACTDCILQSRCAYGYLFETPVPANAPIMRRYPNAPHPFVFRVPFDTPSGIEAGQVIEIPFVLIGRACEYLPFVVLALMRLGELGLGADRLTFNIDSIAAEPSGAIVYRHGQKGPVIPPAPMRARALLGTRRVSRFQLHYLTPMRLRVQGKILRRPDFAPLVSAALRRLELLSRLHDTGDFHLDAARLVKLASETRLIADETHWFDFSRWSRRQGTAMPVGGLIGIAVFEGDIGTFRHILDLAGRLHVGKGIAFGNGFFKVVEENGYDSPP